MRVMGAMRTTRTTRTTRRRSKLVGWLPLLLAAAAQVAAAEPAGQSLARQTPAQGLILLVRHAERATGAPDSLLNAAGERRAECLAETLRDTGVEAILATDARRTQQTAEPLARRLHLDMKVVPQKDLAGMVQGIKAHKAEVVLVVGHADTLPRVVEELGGGPVAIFRSDEYDRLIVVPVNQGVAGRAFILRYCTGASGAGAAAAAPPPAPSKRTGHR